jgi:glyoxylase-like metal-dependent hydrolase (beta-lactamase superfamily II)
MKDAIDSAHAIVLPFPEAPAPGDAIEILPGILWARMPLPLRLNHVNVWLLEETDGWTVVDCGLDTPETRSAWEQLFAGPLNGKPVHRLVATHGHVDHVGLAGWIAARFGAEFNATRAAWLWSRVTFAARSEPTSAEALQHLRRHGCDVRHIDGYARNRGPLLQMFGEPPKAHIRLADGETLSLGGRNWRVITADGHADEHASFYSAEGPVLIAGDQILQRISPVVGVFSGEPLADPLSDYLASFARFRELSEKTLVLPSHGLPFYGLGLRLGELERHHELRLSAARDALDRPRTATECSLALFSRAVADGQWYLALAETLAHLHWLETKGEVERHTDGKGLIRFARK